MSDEQFEEQAIAHLLGELDVSVEIGFQEELARRGAPGQAIVRELRETLGELALAVAPAEPPPSLRARVLWSAGAPVAPTAAPPASTRSFWAWALAGLAIAAAVGLGVWAARLADDRAGLEATVARLEARLAARDSLATNGAALQRGLDFVGAAGTTVRELRGTGAAPEASARLFLDGAGRGLLLARGLPSLPAGRFYALWVMDGGPAGPAAVFRPDESGRGRLELEALDLDPGDNLAISAEPASPGDRPSGPIVLDSS